MRVSTVGAKITCYRDDRAKLRLADGRTFDADKIQLRALGGKVIASPVGCDLFALPKKVELVPRENAELYDVATTAKKVRRPPAAVEDACRRFRIGRRFGHERLLDDAEVDRLREKLAGKPAAKRTSRRRPAASKRRATTLRSKSA